MNSDLLRRAILSAWITILLAAAGFLLSSGALGAQTQDQRPLKYLPLIIGKAISAQEQTGTAAATFASATAAAVAGTSTATTTPTPTATATATTTNTSATATSSPTGEVQATIQLHVGNLTGWPLTFTLAGPTNASGSIQANASSNLTIRPGYYTITAQTHCGTIPVEFDTVPDVVNDITYTCS